MPGDSANKTLEIPTLKFEPVIIREHGQRRSTDGDELDSFLCGVCLSNDGKTAIRGTIDCCDHTFCFVCIVKWAKVKSFCPICKLTFTTIYGPQKNVIFASKRLVNVPQGNQANYPFGNATSGLFNPHEEIKCRVCHGIADESNRRLLCDICDSAVHTYCVGFSATVPPGGAWFCYGCALSRSNHDKTKVNIAIDNQKISGNFNVKLPVETSVPFFGIARESNIPEVGHHNPSFSSRPNYLSPPFLAGRRIVDEANGPSEKGHHLSPHLGGKKSGKGRTRARVTELEKLVQSLQQKIEDEQEKRVRLEDHMTQIIEQNNQERIDQQIEEKIQQHFDQMLTMRMQQMLLKVHAAVSSSKPPV